MNHDLYQAIQSYGTPRPAILALLLNQCKYVAKDTTNYKVYFFKHSDTEYYYVRVYKHEDQITVLRPLNTQGMDTLFWSLPNNPMHVLALAAKELEV